MIPKGAAGIAHLGTRLLTDVLPRTEDAYTAADLGMTYSLIDMVAQDYDRAADVLVSDDAGLRAILREAQPLVAEGALRDRIAAALASQADGLRIGQLSAHADQMLKVFIDLHHATETAEEQGAPWAAALNLKLWAFLDSYVAKRTYQSLF